MGLDRESGKACDLNSCGKTLFFATSDLGIGIGILAARDIKEGEVIERSPIIVVPSAQRTHLDKTELYNYYYDWANGHAAVALCHGSTFNHSYAPNAVYTKNLKDRTIDFTALRDIEAGEEVFVNYNGDPTSLEPLWFKTVSSEISP